MSEEALQIAVKIREAKAKEERERYIQFNAEFQRIAKRDKDFHEQSKAIEGNNGMGKTRDLFKKTGDTQETVHAKISTIKDRNMART